MSREHVLHKIRTALGRSVGQAPSEIPPARLAIPRVDAGERLKLFFENIEKLAGKTYRAASPADVRAYVASLLDGKNAVASNAAVLRECGITSLPGVQSGFTAAAGLREACQAAHMGITGADWALADTGSVVLLSSPEEARMISLLPAVHLAVVREERLLTGLDELFTVAPRPAELSSSLVIITGPSRTADIEQILVRGVHGPGEIHVVVV